MNFEPDSFRDKNEARKFFLARRRSIDAIARLSAHQNIQRHLEKFVINGRYDYVFGYLSTKTEVCLDGFLRFCFLRGLKVAIPRIQDEQTVFYRFDPLKHKIIVGAYQMRETEQIAGELPVSLPASAKTLVCVPGVAFDRFGNRLGRGKGHYDKSLSQLDNFTRLGVLYRNQLSKGKLPIENHDVKMDSLVSPDGIMNPSN